MHDSPASSLPARGQSARGKVISKLEDSALSSELIHQRGKLCAERRLCVSAWRETINLIMRRWNRQAKHK